MTDHWRPFQIVCGLYIVEDIMRTGMVGIRIEMDKRRDWGPSRPLRWKGVTYQISDRL